MASNVPDTDADPIIAEYDIFITPPNQIQQLYVLQYPERPREKYVRKKKFPSSMRVKSASGFMELDVPTSFASYDKSRGLRWGEAMKQARDDGVKSFGISGGFAPVFKPKGRALPQKQQPDTQDADSPNGDASESIEDAGQTTYELAGAKDFDQARADGRVLVNQTLGGQVVSQEAGRPLYMVAAFRGSQCHLTPSTGIVQMRPQFHYIDAQTRLEQIAKRRSAAETFQTAEPQAIFDRAKAADGIEEANHLKTLQQARAESWTNLTYHNEDANDSYAEYYDSLFAQESAKDVAVVSAASNDDYLDAISAPRTDTNGRLRKRLPSKKQTKTEEDVSEESDAPT